MTKCFILSKNMRKLYLCIFIMFLNSLLFSKDAYDRIIWNKYYKQKKLTNEDLELIPDYNPEESPCPLNRQDAIKLTRTYLDNYFKGKNYHWNFFYIRLQRLSDNYNKWGYYVVYRLDQDEIIQEGDKLIRFSDIKIIITLNRYIPEIIEIELQNPTINDEKVNKLLEERRKLRKKDK